MVLIFIKMDFAIKKILYIIFFYANSYLKNIYEKDNKK
jgi:hypothetical protein